jgi:hypothetical protein
MLYHYFKPTKIGGSLDLIFDLHSVIDTAEIEFANFQSEYLGKNKALCKTQDPRWIWFMKKPEVKNLMTGSH